MSFIVADGIINGTYRQSDTDLESKMHSSEVMDTPTANGVSKLAVITDSKV